MSDRIEFDFAMFMALVWRMAAKRIDAAFAEWIEEAGA
jgi:hypothetical protein